MELSEFTVRLIFLFVPGIIGTTIFNSLQNRGQLSNREYFVETLLIGVVSYLITYSLQSVIDVKSVFFNALFDQHIQISIKEIALACVVSLALGIIQSLVVNNGWLYKFGGFTKITTRTGHSSVWDEVFDNQNKGISDYVYVKCPNRNLVYAGFVDKYSMQYFGNKELYLINVSIFNYEHPEESTDEIDSVYIQFKEDEEIIIEFKKPGGNQNEQQSGTEKQKPEISSR